MKIRVWSEQPVRNTHQHADNRLNGAGLLKFKHNSWQHTYMISQNSPQKEALEIFLTETFQ